MSATKLIISMGLILPFAACETSQQHHASNDTLRRKTVHSPYIAANHGSDSEHGAYRNYGTVASQQPAAIAAPPSAAYAPAEVTPTGAHRTVIDQVTNEPIRYGQEVTH